MRTPTQNNQSLRPERYLYRGLVCPEITSSPGKERSRTVTLHTYVNLVKGKASISTKVSYSTMSLVSWCYGTHCVPR